MEDIVSLLKSSYYIGIIISPIKMMFSRRMGQKSPVGALMRNEIGQIDEKSSSTNGPSHPFGMLLSSAAINRRFIHTVQPIHGYFSPVIIFLKFVRTFPRFPSGAVSFCHIMLQSGSNFQSIFGSCQAERAVLAIRKCL